MKVNPLNYEFHIKEGDTYPPLRIRLYNTSIDEAFNLQGYTGKFYMAPLGDKASPVVDGGTVNITDATNGEAQYEWSSADTATAGQYTYEFRFTKGSDVFTVPVISPGVIYVETKIGVAS